MGILSGAETTEGVAEGLGECLNVVLMGADAIDMIEEWEWM